MSPEDRALLEKTYKLAEENNSLLRSIRRNARWATAMKVIYWSLIIGLSFGAYYFIQPFLKAITGGAFGNGDTQSSMGSGSIQDTVNQIQGLLK